MTLVEDYLRAVAMLLPKAQREDIAAELRDMILTRIETLEAEKRRPLSEAETEDVLREVGHPLVVAARYRGGPQHVVGPTLYPYWSFGVKVAVTIQFALAGLVFLAHALGGHETASAFGAAVGSALTGSTIVIGIATMVAWLMERGIVRVNYVTRWRVRDLRLLEFASWDIDAWGENLSRHTTSPRSPRRATRRGRWRSNAASRGLTAIVTGLVLILWWIGALRFDLVGSPADLRDLGLDVGPLSGVNWAAAEAVVNWSVLAYALAIVLRGVLSLGWPRAPRARALVDVSIGVGVVGVSIWLWSYSSLAPYVQVSSLTGLALRVKALLHGGVPVSLAACLTVLLAANIFGGLVRLVRGFLRLIAPPGWTHTGFSTPEGAARRIAVPTSDDAL